MAAAETVSAAHNVGTGNWRRFAESGISVQAFVDMAAAAAAQLQGIEKPWLCWNVDSDWCAIQQRLVKSVGWTPVVGFDPRVGAPALESGSVLIDFNKTISLPVMWMHVPIDFVFLMCDRMAFWHSDLLLRPETMMRVASLFEGLADGAMAAVVPNDGFRMKFRPKQRRYWELLGCMTRGASRSQFETGCGWWMNFQAHPNNSPEEQRRRAGYYWDHGAGIRYWHKKRGGSFMPIASADVDEGHFTRINRADYQRHSPQDARRDISKELSANNHLATCCHQMGLEHLLGETEQGLVNPAEDA